MITDMHRLERAARLSMGDFEAASPAVAPPRRTVFASKALAALAALTVLVIGALLLG